MKFIDGMSLVQKAKTSELTSGKLAKELFRTTLAIGSDSSRTEIVFDQYEKIPPRMQNIEEC